VIQALIILAVLVALALFLTAPLRRASAEVPAQQQIAETAAETQLAELEAAREAKYRELRDADLDHRTGKLSDEDYQALDTSLRAEAVEILNRLQKAATISER
jgi:hypothetical protein